ncbi:MAG: LPS export ABC transporter periplasmic protein LptC [Deltaproteobacteria bacterium]|nr:LPS export ABC transporter periplasmic protein LptC [Deltaproteobacteria bacterium]
MVGINKQKRLLKFALILAIAITIATVVTIFVRYRRHTKGGEETLHGDRGKATISIGKVHHTATRDGVREWTLTADSADYMDSENQAFLNNLEVVFYMKDGDAITVHADRGYLKTDTKDIKVEGNVVVDNGVYRLETSTLSYNHTARRLYTHQAVKVWGDMFTLSADNVSVDLKSRRSEFLGNVRGVLSEAFNL